MKPLDQVLVDLGFAEDPECVGTAERFVELLREFSSTAAPPALDPLVTHSQDPLVVRDVPFHSLCAHHLLPFFGTATLAIRPNGRIAGLGALARSVEHFARRPQIQERLGAQLARHLGESLRAGVLVRLSARQMCMELRGPRVAATVETWSSHGDVHGLRELVGA